MSALSENYAIALFELAHEAKALNEIKETFEGFIARLDQESENFFLHPKIGKNEKKEIVDQLAYNRVFTDFLKVIIDNNRFASLKDIYTSFQAFIEKQGNIMRVVVHSQKPLNKARVDALKTEYEKNYKRQVMIENKVDESILGGLRFEYDGMIVDDTVNHTIDKIKSRLTK